jgi:hypothetical protein
VSFKDRRHADGYRALSALHLDVLQSLILGSGIPDALMLVVRPGVLRLLSGNMGLEDVLQSSRFDIFGVKAKLDVLQYRSVICQFQFSYTSGVGSANGWTVAMPVVSVDILGSLRAQLQAVRQINPAQGIVFEPLLHAFHRALESEGRLAVVDLIVREVSRPTSIFLTAKPDPVSHIAVLLLSWEYKGDLPLSVVFFGKIIPGMLDPSARPYIELKQPYTSTAVCRLIKYILLVTQSLYPDMARELGDELVREMKYQLSRPVRVKAGGKRKKGVVRKGVGTRERF